MDGSSPLNTFLLQPLVDLWVLANAQVGGTTPDSAQGETWKTYGVGALYVLGIFVVPFILSHFIARAVRMPAHGFRIGVMIAAIFAGVLFAWGNNFQLTFGPDMKGGTTLVYDIMPDQEGNKIDAGSLATALSERINPSGTKEISIRPRGETQIEITVPMVDEFELQKIKELLQNSGQLEFRIVANTRDHPDIIDLAEKQARTNASPKKDVLDAAGEKVVGRWYTVGREKDRTEGVYPLKTPVLGDIIRDSTTGQLIKNPPLDTDENYALEKWLDRQGIRRVDVLMALQVAGIPYAQVVGDDLASASTEFDKVGQPTVAFKLTPSGAQKMFRMTRVNMPEGNFHRRMAIIMDEHVLSAPQLNSHISDQGQITGNFTSAEVEFLVNILRSGRLPATLGDQPESENRVGAGLGATTIRKGKLASIWAIIATFACVLVYYRFAGVVASIALLINGLLIFGIMIFIRQPLTLPGLAGLVLTLGMSVDANVLIFERIREEKSKGSAPRMSIRNGFDRAFTTIVDSNLTTLIAAIVLYWIGTDQVRGFAVALIIGIATSMFTATFCARIIFEIAEKLRIVSLSMADGVGFLKGLVLGKSDINFMSARSICAVISIALVTASIGAVTMRGGDLLNIDFTGGTSVTFRLEEPVEPERLRSLTKEILNKNQAGEPVQSTLVRIEKEPLDTVYTLVTSIENREQLSKQLLEGFSKNDSANPVTYRVKVTKSLEASTGMYSVEPRVARMVSLPAAQELDAQEPDALELDPQELDPQELDAQELDAQELDAQELDAQEPDEQASEAPEALPEDGSDESAGGQVEATDSGPDVSVGAPSGETTVFLLEFQGSDHDNPKIGEEDRGAKYAGPILRAQLVTSAEAAGVDMNPALVEVAPDPLPTDWEEDDITGYTKWRVSLPLGDADAASVLAEFEAKMQQEPLWLSLSQIGSKVADEMQQRAVAAILVSLVFIVAYIWFRFQKISYGLAAVVALVHDVIITLGIIAVCGWLYGPLRFLLIEDFKIGLTEVAAFLTIIGYSLNDTIVVFDRIREVRGRSPKLDAAMLNQSINQTLSRTLLTSGTTMLTVLLLYIFGGEGIHAFSFALLIGIIVGTYSSIFVAAPMLLWLSNRESGHTGRPGAVA